MHVITRNDIMQLVNSQFIIVWHRGNYIVRSTRHSITVAIGFGTWVDALIFLKRMRRLYDRYYLTIP